MGYLRKNEPKLYKVVAPIVIAGIMLCVGWKYMTNQSAKIRANELETKVVQTADINDVNSINYISNNYRR